MPSVFTFIMAGALPGHFVWQDERCVALLSINPLKQGHTLVIPRDEVDHWIDLEPDLLQHLTDVAQKVSLALQDAFEPEKVGLMIAGLEVRHVHLHLVPITGLGDLDFANQASSVPREELESVAHRIRAALVARGFDAHTDG